MIARPTPSSGPLERRAYDFELPLEAPVTLSTGAVIERAIVRSWHYPARRNDPKGKPDRPGVSIWVLYTVRDGARLVRVATEGARRGDTSDWHVVEIEPLGRVSITAAYELARNAWPTCSSEDPLWAASVRRRTLRGLDPVRAIYCP